MRKLARYITGKFLLFTSVFGLSSVQISLNQADDISKKFDIKFGIKKAFAGFEFIGSECTRYKIESGSVSDGCGNFYPGSVTYGSDCVPQYGYVPGDPDISDPDISDPDISDPYGDGSGGNGGDC